MKIELRTWREAEGNEGNVRWFVSFELATPNEGYHAAVLEVLRQIAGGTLPTPPQSAPRPVMGFKAP
jgi:hypothetical protein